MYVGGTFRCEKPLTCGVPLYCLVDISMMLIVDPNEGTLSMPL